MRLPPTTDNASADTPTARSAGQDLDHDTGAHSLSAAGAGCADLAGIAGLTRGRQHHSVAHPLATAIAHGIEVDHRQMRTAPWRDS